MAYKAKVKFMFDGKAYFCYGSTKAEAEEKAVKKRAELVAGLISESRKTVNEWFEEYVDAYKVNAGRKTLQDFRSMYRCAVAPYLGAKQLRQVKAIDCQRVMNSMAGKSLSYIKQVRGMMRSLFQAAVDNELLNKNPVVNLRLPDAESGERRALTELERSAFLDAAAKCGDQGLFFLVMYHCGLRPSEVARIRGEHIDYEHRLLRVQGTKTKAAVRTVPIPDGLELPRREGYLFLTRWKDKPGETARRQWWAKVKAEMEKQLDEPVDEELTPYCLRHDYCTRLQEAGVPIDVARRLMGHSNISVTSKIYTHESSDVIELARGLINDKDAKRYHQKYHRESVKPCQYVSIQVVK